MVLREAMNTYHLALFIIKDNGYDIKVEEESDSWIWIAIKDEKEVVAFNPLSLLALVTMVEKYGETWREVKTGNLYDEIIDKSITG